MVSKSTKLSVSKGDNNFSANELISFLKNIIEVNPDKFENLEEPNRIVNLWPPLVVMLIKLNFRADGCLST